MIRNVVALGAALALIAVLSGCSKVSTAEAVRFNDALVGAAKRIEDAARAVGNATLAAIDGGIVEVAGVKREQEKEAEAYARMKSEIGTIKVPDSPAARKFLEAHQKLYDRQQSIFTEDMKSIIEVLEDPLLAPDARRKKIVSIGRHSEASERDAVRAYHQTQVEFAQTHGFQLK